MNFIKNRSRSYLVSLIVLGVAICAFLFLPKNLGIDMTGGIQITYDHRGQVEVSVLENVTGVVDSYEDRESFVDVLVYQVEGNESFRVEAGIDPSLDVAVSDKLSEDFRSYLVSSFRTQSIPASESAYVKIGNSLGTYVRQTAMFTLIVSLILIALYLTYAFRGSLKGWGNLTFGFITLITLAHDVLIATGLYVLLGTVFGGLQIDTFFVTALLTILGYSINDTIVVLDRIRSSLKKKNSEKKRTELFNTAISSSVRRSLFTSLTLVFVLVVLILIGPSQLLGFVVLLLIGTIVGTYSSLFIAAPLVYDLQERFSRKNT